MNPLWQKDFGLKPAAAGADACRDVTPSSPPRTESRAIFGGLDA
jgi:hypothetical protein